MFSFTTSYNKRLEKISSNTKVITNIETEKTELEATINMGFNEIKYEKVSSLDTKISAIASTKPSYCYDQTSANIIKWKLQKSTENIPMHHNSPNIYLPWPSKETLFFRFKNGGISSFINFAKYLLSNKIWPACKYIKEEHQNISSFILPPETNPKFDIAKKTMKNDQDHSDFILLNMKLFPPKKHQNHMSN